jgi:amidase
MAAPMWQWSAVETAAAIRDGHATSEEVVHAHIDRMCTVNPAINAVVVDLSAQAIEAACAADQARAEGGCQGKLHGVPVTITHQSVTKTTFLLYVTISGAIARE